KQFFRVAEFGDFINTAAEIKTDQGCGDDAKREQPLENARAFAANAGGETFGQIQRHDDADQTAADALQETPEDQEAVAVRQCDDGHADDKEHAAENHHTFAPEKIREHAGEESGKNATK